MNIKEMNKSQLTDKVNGTVEIEDLRAIAKELGVTFSGNTGVESLTAKVLKQVSAMPEVVEQTASDAMAGLLSEDNGEEIQIAKVDKSKVTPIEDLLKMDPTKIADVKLRRQVVRAKALRLIRVSVVNMDMNDNELDGAIITAYNKYTGKVSKFVPFGEKSANGYHLPKIIVDFLRNQKYVQRRSVPKQNGVGKEYRSILQNKYTVTELPPLTEKEISDMAARQTASQSIG